jgi:hypothetical protein
MKSFAKISLLFALIITGRYLQPAVATSLATTHPVSTTQVLPLVLARYTSTPLLGAQANPEHSQPTQMRSSQGYFL